MLRRKHNKHTKVSFTHNRDTLFNLIVCRKWEESLKRMKEQPHETISLNTFDRKTSLLHLAITYRAPVELISNLASIHPEWLLFQESMNHFTPLHIASNFRTRIGQGLSDTDTYTIDVLQCLLEAYPDAARMKTHRDGWLPLHIACQIDETPISVVKLLVDIDIDTLIVPNKGGVTPLQILCDSLLESIKDDQDFETSTTSVLDSEKEASLSLEFMSPPKIFALLASKGIDVEHISSYPFWQKIHFAVNALFCHHFSYDREAVNPSLVHAIANATIVPRDIVSLALALHPNQIRISNHDGLLPLHISILACGKSLTLHDNSIDLFVKIWPEAARKPFRWGKHKGRAPLNVAIENTIHWRNGIKSIFKAAPEILRQRDIGETLSESGVNVGTGLYPFMLAASTMYSDGKCDENEDREQLEVIYQLLRACPVLVII